jgi:glycerol-3-phosphate dehydrogenase (NAD(P)+)
VYTSGDLPGVEVAGALVEVLAMALGIARGLGLGVGAQAMLVTRGAVEGARLAAKEQGDPRTFSGLAGIGELVAAAGLPDHPAHVRGLAMARGEPDPEAAALCEALLGRVAHLPITAAVRTLAQGRARPAEVIASLMQREQTGELDS